MEINKILSDVPENSSKTSIDDFLQGTEDIQLKESDFEDIWKVLHTPISRNEIKVGRNDICPYCNSGKKFKHCECYKTHKVDWVQKPVFGRDK